MPSSKIHGRTGRPLVAGYRALRALGRSSCGHNDHADLLDALEAKDAAKARALMLQHLDHIEADLDLRMKEGLALKDALAL